MMRSVFLCSVALLGSLCLSSYSKVTAGDPTSAIDSWTWTGNNGVSDVYDIVGVGTIPTDYEWDYEETQAHSGFAFKVTWVDQFNITRTYWDNVATLEVDPNDEYKIYATFNLLIPSNAISVSVKFQSAYLDDIANPGTWLSDAAYPFAGP